MFSLSLRVGFGSFFVLNWNIWRKQKSQLEFPAGTFIYSCHFLAWPGNLYQKIANRVCYANIAVSSTTMTFPVYCGIIPKALDKAASRNFSTRPLNQNKPSEFFRMLPKQKAGLRNFSETFLVKKPAFGIFPKPPQAKSSPRNFSENRPD